MLLYARYCILQVARKAKISFVPALSLRPNGLRGTIQLRQFPNARKLYSNAGKNNTKEEFVNLLTQAGVKPNEEHGRQTPKVESPELSPLATNVRRAMRKVSHSITVITPLTGEGDRHSIGEELVEKDSAPLQQGMLVSSFNTVSLVPDPVVSFNIRLPSKTYDAIAESGYFEVSPMWDSRVATRFVNRKGNNAMDEETTLQFPSISQLLVGRLFGLRCEWLKEKSIEVGDHVIILGRVFEVLGAMPGIESKASLLYSGGGYGYQAEPPHTVRPQIMGAGKSIASHWNTMKAESDRRWTAVSKRRGRI